MGLVRVGLRPATKLQEKPDSRADNSVLDNQPCTRDFTFKVAIMRMRNPRNAREPSHYKSSATSSSLFN